MNSNFGKELRHEGLLKRIGRRIEFKFLKQVEPNQSPARTLQELQKAQQDLTPEEIQLLANWRFNLPS